MLEAEMQGDKDRDARGRQIGLEMQAVQMDDIDRDRFERGCNRSPMPLLAATNTVVIEWGAGARDLEQGSGDLRSGAGNDEGPVAGGTQGPVERGEDLFRAAGRVRPYGSERMRDIENSQWHQRHRVSSRSSADLAKPSHSAPESPQS